MPCMMLISARPTGRNEDRFKTYAADSKVVIFDVQAPKPKS